jgi:hypothetical protein
MAVQSSSASMIEVLSELPFRWERALISASVLPNGLGCTVPNTFASFKFWRLGQMLAKTERGKALAGEA